MHFAELAGVELTGYVGHFNAIPI